MYSGEFAVSAVRRPASHREYIHQVAKQTMIIKLQGGSILRVLVCIFSNISRLPFLWDNHLCGRRNQGFVRGSSVVEISSEIPRLRFLLGCGCGYVGGRGVCQITTTIVHARSDHDTVWNF